MLTETDVERIVEALRSRPDTPHEALAWARRIAPDLQGLIDIARAHFGAVGGSFGANLRDALEERILVRLNDHARLTDDTEVKSLGVHVLEGRVVVDVRLHLGRWQQS